MATMQDLIAQVQDAALRDRLLEEANRLLKHKKFGLVFEEHLPECTPLYDIPVRVGGFVAPKAGYMKDIYRVLRMEGNTVVCKMEQSDEEKTFSLDDVVTIAQFGDPIYPCLQKIASVENAPESGLWHTLIEADNYHALQLLEYLYAEKVDCIYIDPPYNTGAKDWKYNNDYVDSSDAYRHSKWLSMMEKRLKLAKKLLNPNDSVLIVTIDEKEYLHLGCLLEEMFPEARMQMITSIIKPEGTQRRNEFSRTNEYIFFVMFGNKYVLPYVNDMVSDELQENENNTPLTYKNFRRTDSNSVRSARPNQFYPIFVDERTGHISGVGKVMKLGETQADIVAPHGQVAVFPVRDSGQEMLWRRTPESFVKTLQDGYAYAQKTNKGYYIKYLSSHIIKQIENGDIIITEKKPNGELLGYYKTEKLTMPKTVWNLKTHSARDYGSLIIKKIFGEEIRFTFPKSLYAVKDSIKLMVANKPNALILDFFAGSGTTLHAVNLLNAEDGGNRRCILVTNNEVSADEAKTLAKDGHKPGDDEWEKLGIARYVTWPRTVCSIEGHDVNGEPLKGTYLGSERPMSDGFPANAIFFKLGFLEKTAVALGTQFVALLSTLWMKAGAVGACPEVEGDELPDMLILPKNQFAVLLEEMTFPLFQKRMKDVEGIRTIFFVTDSEPNFRKMSKSFPKTTTYQLYRDYLSNFRINTGRQSC